MLPARRRHRGGLLLAAVALAACSSACGGIAVVDEASTGGEGGRDVQPPTSCATPAGPYGLEMGETFDPTLCVDGRKAGEPALRELCFRELLRCDGAGPRAIVLAAQAVWAQPSKIDQPGDWKDRFEAIDDAGGMAIQVLVDGVEPGTAADQENLNTWVTAFDIPFFSAIDPDYQLGAQLNTSTYPSFWLLDPDTLRVEARVTGLPSNSFWEAVEAELGE
jgi:hypothetical protein